MFKIKIALVAGDEELCSTAIDVEDPQDASDIYADLRADLDSHRESVT